MSILLEFGSRARGDNDKYSDVDLLEVENFSSSESQEEHIHYYTKRRLQVLKNFKSLFLVHLKKEGRIISDESNWLKNFLDSIQDFQASDDNLNLVKYYLQVLLSINPTDKQISWWFDCLYVFMRDYLIKQNSQYNIYSFSSTKYAKPIKGVRNIDLTNIILTLRKQNKVFRNSQLSLKIDLDINELKQTLMNALSIKLLKENIKAIFISSSIIEQYFRLRLLEGLYLNDEIEILDNDILKFISTPHAYNWEIRHSNLQSKVRFFH